MTDDSIFKSLGLEDGDELGLRRIEKAALAAAENMGMPDDMLDPETGEWIIRDGWVTEYGSLWFDRNYPQ